MLLIQLPCTENGLCAIGYLELTDDIGDIVAHGFGADDQVISNFRVFVTLSQQLEYIAFTAAEFREYLRGMTRLERCEIVDQFDGDAWTEDGVAAADGADGAHHVFVPGTFEEIATRLPAWSQIPGDHPRTLSPSGYESAGC